MNHDISNVGVTPQFSTKQNLLEKVFRKDKYWHNQFRKAFWYIPWQQIMQYTVTRYSLSNSLVE